MASNSFGSLFRFTTWGESHGPAIGVVIDGCPAGIALDEATINRELARRAPGGSSYTSPRTESDLASIESGLFNGLSTGAPISIRIPNRNADSSRYAALADLLRPGHANYTYLQKYGIFDYRGGGRASARETACRVAAGAVARRLLGASGITVAAWLSAVGGVSTSLSLEQGPLAEGLRRARASVLHAPNQEAEAGFAREIEAAMRDGDSVGGVVSFVATGLPPGLGDPVYARLDALLAAGMLGIPASKGFELGNGFACAQMRGSVCNDRFCASDGAISAQSNHAGGCLGGISTGLPLFGRVAFKPTPSIFIPQDTVDIHGTPQMLTLPHGSRHDPCVAVRAVPVVEAMCLVVLADALLLQRAARGKEASCSLA